MENVVRKPKEIINLQDDIDAPVKNMVQYLNLWGVKTVWSCCGFDYQGQLPHKDHISGQPQVACECTPESFEKISRLIAHLGETSRTIWTARIEYKMYNKLELVLMAATRGPMWGHPKSPHFHEGCVMALAAMEKSLLSFQSEFIKEVVIEDANRSLIGTYEYWDYQPTNSWEIKNDHQ